ncbi:hypothetical protein ACS0PU_005809 [Formica fusca]
MPKRSRAGFYKKISTELNKNLSLLSPEFIDEERNDVISKDITEIVPLLKSDKIIEENLDRDIPEDNSYFVNDVSDPWNEQLVNKKNTASTSDSSFKNNLKDWSLKHKIGHSAFSDLLKLLKTSNIDPNDLPSDARTLLSTPRISEIQKMEPGIYYHFGLSEAIKKLYKDDGSNTIEVLINIDGLPLSKSSSSQIYPILCSLYSNPTKIAAVGIYHGYEKPINANEFLLQFVNEAIDLTTNNININESIKEFKIKGFICDASAKSFIYYIKGHTGFYSCTKCFQKGTYLKGRTCFPKINCKKRTGQNFQNKSQIQHHSGTSVIEKIPRIDMVSHVPLEYMHLICFGIIKKLLMIWTLGKPHMKLKSEKINKINRQLLSIVEYTPNEFARKPRSLDEMKRWKATEFRFFLLYVGPVVLKENIGNGKYINFLCLHIAVTIFSNEQYIQEYADYAHALLKCFVQNFGKLYGKENISHDIHGLIHIYDDIQIFGNLNKYSAFPFENFLQNLKNLLRKHEKPLQQIVIRLKKLEQTVDSKGINKESFLYEREHFNGLVPNQNYIQFKKLNFEKFSFNIESLADSFCYLTSGHIMKIENILVRKDTYVYRRIFLETNNLFDYPCDSSIFNIRIAKNLSEYCIRSVRDIKNKMVAFTQEEGFIFYPFLH